MKKFLLAAMTMALSILTSAQLSIVDSLKYRLSTAVEDSDKMKLMIRIGIEHEYSTPDTTIHYCMEALPFTRQMKDKMWESNALLHLGEAMSIKGNYSKALEVQLKALKLCEESGTSEDLVWANCYIANVYYYSGDYKNALNYYYKAKLKYYTDVKFKPKHIEGFVEKFLNGAIGESYFYLHQLDSSLLYTQITYALEIRDTADNYHWAVPYIYLGHIYAAKKQYPLAMDYYRAGLSAGAALKDTLDIYTGMGKVYNNTGVSDSAIYYAKETIRLGLPKSFLAEVIDAGAVLKELYSTKGRLDSAFYFQEIMVAAKDSLFSQEKVKEVQNLSFNENLRQQEITEQQLQAREERKNNLQLMGIAAFIFTFLLFVLLLLRKKTNPRLVEMLGLVGLLLIFEFISLLMHPYIAAWTNHKPVYMLLILVAIAAILVPAHHRLTGWLKRKLLHKTAIKPEQNPV